ncbi:MAG: hypothetical protein ACOCQH_01520 [Halanaerobiales bacterium]
MVTDPDVNLHFYPEDLPLDSPERFNQFHLIKGRIFKTYVELIGMNVIDYSRGVIDEKIYN